MLKLGSQTGSLVNHMLSAGTKGEPVPVVGMGCTFLSWTDRSAGTIVKVEEIGGSKRWLYQIECQADNAKRIDKNGMSESQEYEFSPNPEAYVEVWRKSRESGAWIRMKMGEKGKYVQSKSGGLRIGSRDYYHDFSF